MKHKQEQYQQPIVKIGTKLPQGKVVKIRHGSVVVERGNRKTDVSFAEVEKFFEGEK
jgi:hypothetical protein